MSAVSLPLNRMLVNAANKHEDRLALWAMDETMTYKELLRNAEILANALCSKGVVKGDRISILHERSCGLYVSILACILCGAAYVPLNPNFPKTRNSQILKSSAVKLMLVDEANNIVAKSIVEETGISCEIFCARNNDYNASNNAVDIFELNDTSNANLPADCNEDDLVYLLFTSGSTGTPKGVPITNGNLCAYLDGLNALNPINPSDRFIQLVDVTFDLSAHDIFLAWTNGAALYSVPNNAGAFAARFVNDYEITCWLSVPSTAALMKQAGLLTSGLMPSLRITYFCGEALPDIIANDWVSAAPNSSLTNLYGPTEATIAFSAFRYDPASSNRPSLVPIGYPIGEERMKIFSDEGEVLCDGELGELYLSGRQISPGYWNNPQLTSQKFVVKEGTRWYRTGDLARSSNQNCFQYAGRIDHQVKIQGYRVELSEIEAALRVECNVDIAAVVALQADNFGIIPGCVAYILGDTFDLANLRERLNHRLPRYMVPKRIAFLKALPLNSNGKVDYSALSDESWLQLSKEL